MARPAAGIPRRGPSGRVPRSAPRRRAPCLPARRRTGTGPADRRWSSRCALPPPRPSAGRLGAGGAGTPAASSGCGLLARAAAGLGQGCFRPPWPGLRLLARAAAASLGRAASASLARAAAASRGAAPPRWPARGLWFCAVRTGDPLLFSCREEGKSLTGLGTSQRRGARTTAARRTAARMTAARRTAATAARRTAADDGAHRTASGAGSCGRRRSPGTPVPWPRGQGRALGLTPAALWRNHPLSTVVAVSFSSAGSSPRSGSSPPSHPGLVLYLQEGDHLSWGAPSGRLPHSAAGARPFGHSLLLVTTLQHLMGIGIGAIVYGVLRTRGCPPGARRRGGADAVRLTADLAGVLILPDTLFTLVLMIAVAILLPGRQRRPSGRP